MRRMDARSDGDGPLLPPMAAGPAEGALLRGALLAFVAAVVVLAYRATPSPAAQAAWDAVATRGPSPWALVGTRAAEDLLLRYGYPLDAVLALPLRTALGPDAWAAGGAWLWLTAAGAAGAWAGGRWWGCPWASFACGVAWQVAATPALEAGAPGTLASLAILAVAFGLFVRALDRGTAGAVGVAGVALGALALLPGGGPRWAMLAALQATVLAARGGWAPAVGVLAGVAGVGVLVAVPILAWTWGAGPDPGVAAVRLPLSLTLLALAGVVRTWRTPRRVLLPGLLVVAGIAPIQLGGPSPLPVAALGLALLAGGLLVGGPRSPAVL